MSLKLVFSSIYIPKWVSSYAAFFFTYKLPTSVFTFITSCLLLSFSFWESRNTRFERKKKYRLREAKKKEVQTKDVNEEKYELLRYMYFNYFNLWEKIFFSEEMHSERNAIVLFPSYLSCYVCVVHKIFMGGLSCLIAIIIKIWASTWNTHVKRIAAILSSNAHFASSIKRCFYITNYSNQNGYDFTTNEFYANTLFCTHSCTKNTWTISTDWTRYSNFQILIITT